jgi:hypothetical protein
VIAVFRLPRRNWLGFMPMPAFALAQWSTFVAIKLGYAPNVIMYVGMLTACLVVLAWTLICR